MNSLFWKEEAKERGWVGCCSLAGIVSPQPKQFPAQHPLYPLEQGWGQPRAQHRGAPHTSHTQEVLPRPQKGVFVGSAPTSERNLQLRGEG